MKILIISMETWSSNTNGGNVLTNIFSDFEAEFAQIYCSSGKPDNKICSRYFQMTDSMALNNILKHEKMGIDFSNENENTVCTCLNGDAAIGNVKKLGSYEILRVAREIVWGLSDYKNEELKNFVKEFDPDIIFAPCYGVTYMLSLTEYVSEITNKPIISYISDDSYSFVSIPAPVEPPVRSLRATIPATQSHYSGGGNHHSGN